MPLRASPIDYAQTRKSLVQSLQAATGLGPNQVIRHQGQGPVQPRPKLPYLSFRYRTASMRDGYDALVPTDGNDTLWNYVGSRGIAIDLMAYGRDQDEAYTLGMLVQSGMEQEPIQNILDASGLCVWKIGDVTDMTALLNTGYEGRAMLELELWQGTNILVDLGEMATVTVVGDIEDDGGRNTHVSVTANLAE